MSTNGDTGKSNVNYLQHGGILLNLKKEGNSNTCYVTYTSWHLSVSLHQGFLQSHGKVVQPLEMQPTISKRLTVLGPTLKQ